MSIKKRYLLLAIAFMCFSTAPFYVSYAASHEVKYQLIVKDPNDVSLYTYMVNTDDNANVCIYFDHKSHNVYLVSNESFNGTGAGVNLDSGYSFSEPDFVGRYGYLDNLSNGNSYYCYYASFSRAYLDNLSDWFKFDSFVKCPFYAFDKVDNVATFITTGEALGAVYEPKDYTQDFFLNDFKVSFHRSNSYDNVYWDVSYTIPEELQGMGLMMQITNSFSLNLSAGLNTSQYEPSYSGFNSYYSLDNYPNGFRIYLKDLGSVSTWLNDNTDLLGAVTNILKGWVVGNELVVDLDSLSISGFGGNSIARITDSIVNFEFNLKLDTTWGKAYYGSYNLLDGTNFTYSSTPDNEGQYINDNNVTNNGSYYTSYAEDSFGNMQPTYYYYPVTGLPYQISGIDTSGNPIAVEITGQQLINVIHSGSVDLNLSGGSSGGGSSGSGDSVIINDDDYSREGIIEAIKDGYGLWDDTDTGAKDDGLMSMIGRAYNNLDPSIPNMIGFGLASVITVAIIRTILKR